jgi:hypothetical protein
MIKHDEQWTAPAPLWGKALNGTVTAKFEQPVILRFASDNFMEDFMSILEQDPLSMSDLRVQPETWRGPLPATNAAKLLEPKKLSSKLARKLERLRISGRRTPAGPGSSSGEGLAGNSSSPRQELKLYQPAHQRYYLIAACLVCNQIGYPDRILDAGNQERGAFVIRRLLPPGEPDVNAPMPDLDLNTWEEYAFVSAPAGSGWQKVVDDDRQDVLTLVPGEEQLPLFEMNFEEDGGRRRRLLAGLIPVGRRETYQNAGKYPPFPGQDQGAADQEDRSPYTSDQRMDVFNKTIAGPWKALLEQAFKTYNTLTTVESPFEEEPPETPLEESVVGALKAAREQIQTGSWYILLELAGFLSEHTQNVWQVVKGEGGKQPEDLDEIAELPLYTYLHTEAIDDAFAQNLVQDISLSDGNVKRSFEDAVLAAKANEDGLEKVEVSYDREDPAEGWPSFLFPIADFEIASDEPESGILRGISTDGLADLIDQAALQEALEAIDNFARLVEKAILIADETPRPIQSVAGQPVFDPRDAWFVIRCVMQRPDCGPLQPPAVSASTVPFKMAAFFDPQAPARPIRIGLPVDVSPAGLRKFDKNTAFMMSDMLCGHVKRFKSLTFGDLVLSVLPWPFHKDLPEADAGPCKDSSGALNLGMICSLSIPIITICALILLMIIVNLLDMIFRWLPYFIVCFPLPGLGREKE